MPRTIASPPKHSPNITCQRRGELVDLGRDGPGHVMFGPCFGGDAIVLGIELRFESRLVVALQDPLAMNLEHAAGREAPEQRLAYLRRIDAGFARERERLAHDRQRAADHHLIAHLAQLARAGLPDPDDAL